MKIQSRLLLLFLSLSEADGHGYLKSPRSRNYVAYHSKWWPLEESAPWPESDVQSLNTGGTAARCGKTSTRNYDTPQNNMGTPLPNQIQGSYTEGSLVDFVVVLTAHHKGHFIYKACPIFPGEVASQSCFDKYPLEFVQDNLYGAVKDPNYPARAYLPPVNLPGTITDSSDVPGKKYSHKYRLPAGLTGSNVLIQWHYITANSGCAHEGYENYAWPPGFENQYSSAPCPALTDSGGSFAEQFWNCAEVEITASDASSSSTTATTISVATTTSSTSSSVATTTMSGSSKRAGDSCSVSSECRSGSCFGSICECRNDLDCDYGEICNVYSNGAKYTFKCMEVSRAAGESCVLPSQCQSGSCFRSICECRRNSDCSNGKICDKTSDQFICVDEPSPTRSTSKSPTMNPTSPPTPSPSSKPTRQVISPAVSPTKEPSFQPSISSRPSGQPSVTSQPSQHPSLRPSITSQPSTHLSSHPSLSPSTKPSVTSKPSQHPSLRPSTTSHPSNHPTTNPSLRPSTKQSISTEPSSPPTLPSGPYQATVAAYYASWQWYDRSKLAEPKNIDFTKVDRVNFAFFQTNTAGDIWGTDSWADPNLLFGPQDWNPTPGGRKYCSWDRANYKSCKQHKYQDGLVYLVHAAGAEIYPSIGGWTLSDAFPAMAASATSRKRFADQCKELIKDYGFDGIDLDWEYPGYAEHSGTPQDKSNFNLLLDDVRAALDELTQETGKRYGLIAALPCGPNHMANMDIPHVNSKLDELNVMSYDFGGSWSETTSINAPMVYQGWGPESFSVDDCVRNWIDQGGSREKINLGLSFYGRSFAGAKGMNASHQGADKANWSVDEGTPQYYNILEKLPNMIRERDELTKTPYAYFPAGGLVSYDDERSICEKTEYTIDNNLNGFLIWELSGDLLEDLSTPLLDSINSKLNDPTMPCSSEPQSTSTSSTILNGAGSTAATTTAGGGGLCNRPSTCHSHSVSCGPRKPCPNNGCCSDWGYCGSSVDFCGGDCCQNGPCLDNGCH